MKLILVELIKQFNCVHYSANYLNCSVMKTSALFIWTGFYNHNSIGNLRFINFIAIYTIILAISSVWL